MPHEPDAVHHALKAVDRSRTFAIVAVVAMFLLVVLALGFGLAHARIDDDTRRTKVLFASTAAQMLFVGLCASLLAFHVTRMTKTILRAIELRPPESSGR